MPIAFTYGTIGTNGTTDFAAAGVGDDAVIFASCAIYGDGNYGVNTPAGWSRHSYIQQDSGARGAYSRAFVGAPISAYWSGGSYGVVSWCAVWGRDMDAGGYEISANTNTSPGDEYPPNRTAAPATTLDDLWIAGSAKRFGSGGLLNPAGWTYRTGGGSSVRYSRIWTRVVASASETPGSMGSNESGTTANFTAYVRAAPPAGRGFGTLMAATLLDPDGTVRRPRERLWIPRLEVPDWRRPHPAPA